MRNSILVCVILVVILSVCASPTSYVLVTLDASDQPTSPTADSADYHTAMRLAAEDINNNPKLLPDTTLLLEHSADRFSVARAISKMIEFSNNNHTFVAGNPYSFVSVLTGVVGNVYKIAQLSSVATSSVLSDPVKYPYYSRMSPPSFGQVNAIRDTLLYYQGLQGRGWTDIAVISTTDNYGIDSAQNFIDGSKDLITVLTFRQFLPDDTDFTVELNEVKKSGARVIVTFVVEGWGLLIKQAHEMDLLGDQYVWFGTDAISGGTFEDDDVSEFSRGTVATFQYIPESSREIEAFLDRWFSLDPNDYFGTNEPPSLFALLAYDMIFTAGIAISSVDQLGALDQERVPPEYFTEAIRNVTFVGLTGPVKFDKVGDRIAEFSLLYYVPETKQWKPTALYTENGEYIHLEDVVWYSNTTEIPDLDIREPFHYWSCFSKEEGFDKTGKTISRQTPGSEDVDYIDSDYHCDYFIDCQNLSDESYDCGTNYTILFIIFGIITGVLICVSFVILIFVLIFGIGLKYRRLRAASPSFLVLLLISVIIGYFSVFAWFGKPHPVACGFQPWLLGIAAVSMIASLCVKNFRIWRLFRNKMARVIISDLELLVLWVIIMVPVLVILVVWTIVSTPTAKLDERNDNEHYVCATGGFTGEPGGLVFFFILVAYGFVVLFGGVFLSFVTRNVPSAFNETVVIIPVFLVVQPFNPFVAWILRTVAILYAFTATLVLQFVPPLIGIIFIDKCVNVKVFKSNLSTSNPTNQSVQNTALSYSR